MRYCYSFVALLLVLTLEVPAVDASERPNILMIAVDDLNHWVGHLDRNPQTRTPNIDRLAARGVSFERAYCAVPACEPSRRFAGNCILRIDEPVFTSQTLRRAS